MKHVRVTMDDDRYFRLLEVSMKAGYSTIADYLMSMTGFPDESQTGALLTEAIACLPYMPEMRVFKFKDLVPVNRWGLYTTDTRITAGRMFAEKVEARLIPGVARVGVTHIHFYIRVKV